MNFIQRNKKTAKTNIINCFVTLFVLVSSLFLFTNYVNGNTDSDYPAHIRHALRGDGYSIMSVLVRILYDRSDTSYFLFAVIMSFAVVGTVFACAHCIKTILTLSSQKAETNELIPLSALSIYLCKICIPDWSNYYYKGSMLTQSWHNSTYTLMRLSGLITMALFFRVQKNYKEKITLKDCMLFTASLTMTNLCKPNFFLGFAPIMLMTLIYDFVKSNTRSFINAVKFGSCTLISCIVLLFQYSIMFGNSSNGESGMAISFSNAAIYFKNNIKFPIHFVLNFAFVLIVSFFFFENREKIDSYTKRVFVQTWCMFIISFIESLFLIETGPRAADGNFGWGLQFFSYLLSIMCLAAMIKMGKERIIDDKKVVICKYTYIAQCLYGIFYFFLLCIGYYYYF